MMKKAQMQMSETVFVVFIIIIIILLGFVTYSKFQEISIREQQKTARNMAVIESAHRLSFWPELECSEAGGITEFMCLDITKVLVLEDFINKSRQQNKYAFNYYFSLLGNSKIIITQIYPAENVFNQDSLVLWNNPGKTKTTDTIMLPVNLYNPLTRQYAFGVMELQMYE
jgi:hypothetical protein